MANKSNKPMYEDYKKRSTSFLNPPIKVKYVCFMDYRSCEVHFCTVKIPKLGANEDEGSYIENVLTEMYGYNSDCYYMSSDNPIMATMH